MFSHVKDLIIGPSLPTQAAAHEQLNKLRALAAFSPDALASIAYANQEIYLGLLAAGSAGLNYAWPISIAIASLLAVVALGVGPRVRCRGSSQLQLRGTHAK